MIAEAATLYTKEEIQKESKTKMIWTTTQLLMYMPNNDRTIDRATERL